MRATPETAAQLDRFIDDLLRDEAGLRVVGAEGDLAATARLLRDSLPRFHPRFAFTERLARQLVTSGGAGVVGQTVSEPPGDRLAGRAGALRAAAAPMGEIIPIGLRSHPLADDAGTGVTTRRLGLVAGGAIASGVSLLLPIAGAALLRWRRSRGSGNLA